MTKFLTLLSYNDFEHLAGKVSFKHGDHNISTVGSTGLENLTYAEDEPDEYDEDDLELDEDMFGDYLDTMNDEETDLC